MKRLCMPDGSAKSMEGIEGNHEVDHQDMVVNSSCHNEAEEQLSLHTEPTPHGRKADEEAKRDPAAREGKGTLVIRR